MEYWSTIEKREYRQEICIEYKEKKLGNIISRHKGWSVCACVCVCVCVCECGY